MVVTKDTVLAECTAVPGLKCTIIFTLLNVPKMLFFFKDWKKKPHSSCSASKNPFKKTIPRLAPTMVSIRLNSTFPKNKEKEKKHASLKNTSDFLFHCRETAGHKSLSYVCTI